MIDSWTITIGPMFGIRSIGGYRAGPDAEDHELGLGLDFMVNADAASGRALAQFVQAHASELGVHYVIWQQHIWNIDRPAEDWPKVMCACPCPPGCRAGRSHCRIRVNMTGFSARWRVA